MLFKQSKIKTKRNSSLQPSNSQSGFSLIEVLITSFIIGIISVLVIMQYSSFNSTVLLKNQAHEIALALREAQAFSISSTGNNNDFRAEYGMYIDLRQNSNAEQQVVLFIDDNNNKEYDASDTILETIKLDSRFIITQFCTVDKSNNEYCQDYKKNNDVNKQLSISFARPNFDAHIKVHSKEAKVSATIKIAPVAGGVISSTINLASTGMISVKTGL